MTANAVATRQDTPFRTLITNLDDMYELVDSYAEENDAQGRIAEEVLEAVHASGITRAMMPREFGGLELRPTELLTANRTLSYADPSTGWVSMAYAFLNGLAGAFLEPEVVEELLGSHHLAIAGQGTRPGKAERSGDGYVLSGRFFFGSGVKHATHIHTAAVDSATGEPRFFLVPAEKVDFIENWDVMGLRATGSIDYTLDAVHIPAKYSYATLSTNPITGGSLYHVGIGNFASINHGGWALGVGRRILDEVAKIVRRKAEKPGSIAENASFHEQYATAELRLRSAHALLYDAWAQIEDALYVHGQGTVPMELQTLNRAALVNATRALEDIAAFAYRTAGSEALRRGTLQRLFRDVHGGMQHISSSAQVLQSTGRYFAGLADGQKWVHFDLKRG
ncbi:acyl-CoA dehydrogenase family protein [Pseudarthrobacter sulfonivorans]|uniref:acyl-CoA dehydrogenase family protein n=1 Tax=Pseudarthrobacter sulfonivorans TaxID=121292 RepID=UPI0027D8A512|nr:acyl-CoA dehydrogenase family protein [Pseudarthrobacter sulfonivorans]